MAHLKLTHLTKRFGERLAVDQLDLEMDEGEFLVLVGPSGCGKSTTLRMIAGLEQPSAGMVEIQGRDVTHTPPWRREVAMVFQHQALYPHLTVADNLAFGLRRLSWTRTERRKQVERTAELLGIRSLLPRRAADLSGGERQRVAVGRAIARPARVYLFDEPLSSLDPPLRATLRGELAALQQALRATFLYVTHDQLEALSLGHRLAVLHQGRMQQVGEPTALYQRPRNRFVAEFLGDPPMVLHDARITADGLPPRLESAGIRIPLPDRLLGTCESFRGRDVLWGIRAEQLSCQVLVENGTLPTSAPRAVDGKSSEKPSTRAGALPPGSELQGRVERVQLRGFDSLVTVHIEEGNLRQTARVLSAPPRVGQAVSLGFDTNHLYLMDPATGRSLEDGT